MTRFSAIVFLFLLGFTAVAQKDPVVSFCGRSGNITMTWEEFSACKKELVTDDKKVQVGSFILFVPKAEKKDSTMIEFQVRGGLFNKQAKETIEKLHKDKKLGKKLVIEAVEVLESGRSARKVPGITITLN